MNKLVLYILLAFFCAPLSGLALEVDREVLPRLILGGRLISTMDYLQLDSQPNRDSHINLDDSALLLAMDKRIYDMQGVAGAVVGFRDGDQGVLMQHMYGRYWRESRRWKIGRTRLPSTLIEIPTLRDDDLLEYSHVLNAGSNEEFDQVYGDLVSFDWFVKGKTQNLNVWFGTRGSTLEGINSYGIAYLNQQPEDLIYVKSNRHWGVRIDRQEVDIGGTTEWMTAYLIGIDQNLNRNPSGIWNVTAQLMQNMGLDNATVLSSVSSRAKSPAVSFVSSINFTHRPKLLTRHRYALSLAYKDYSDVDNANQFSIVPSYLCRFGQGIDMVAQLVYTENGTALGGGSDLKIQFGLSFSFDAVFNDQIGERDSILNLEHGYLP